MDLKLKACELPAEKESVHFSTRQQGLTLFDASIENIIQYTVKGILALLPQAASKGSIPTQLIDLCCFVKGQDYVGNREVGGGRILPSAAGAPLLKYLPFQQRCFVVYIADVVVALSLQAKLDTEKDTAIEPPFQTALAFLDVAASATDVHRCDNQKMVEAIQEILSLGLGLVSNQIKFHFMICSSSIAAAGAYHIFSPVGK